MRLLVLGGTRFLGRAIAAHAHAIGHDVTCAARGVAGTVPDGTRFIQVDRDQPDGLAPLAQEKFDAVVDVSRHPGQARGGDVLVAAAPDDTVQLVDVRDLAEWIVHAAETRLIGGFDGIGPSILAPTEHQGGGPLTGLPR